MNHYFLNNNLSSTMGLGWYTQYMYTNQTDDNDRHLLFTSLYYNIKHTPVIKAGYFFNTYLLKINIRHSILALNDLM
ncbi:hypothetical protein [Aquimarina hainanensis]|uniref:hypothetical protein n=1 Tax=Aquimarina hainanensis TaxID=1578017 RepID=UPI00361DBD12